jgi:hypothetical protein
MELRGFSRSVSQCVLGQRVQEGRAPCGDTMAYEVLVHCERSLLVSVIGTLNDL